MHESFVFHMKYCNRPGLNVEMFLWYILKTVKLLLDEHICMQETSTAKYIVQQYLAAVGGLAMLNTVSSMYAVGQVKMNGSAMQEGEDSSSVHTIGKGEIGGFVLWQKNPDLWYLELVVSGFKVSAGSDGKVAWNQCSSQPCHANKGPPRPLRRFFQVRYLIIFFK